MIRFTGITLVAYLGYLLLTTGSGTAPLGYGLWSSAELAAGAVFALVVAAVWRRFFSREGTLHMFNPLRWLLGGLYMAGPFFYEMARANLDVAKRVVTGKVNPAILRLETGLKTDLATTFLAHSITLTPGTLTLEVDPQDNALYIHQLSHTEGEPAAAPRLLKWVRRFGE